ncbi:hypothetical protein Tco_1182676 [Tanacetum coccineum]
MIVCGQFVTKLAKKMQVLTDVVLDGPSALIYCRPLDATTLRELIGPYGRLIAEDLTPSVPRVAMPRPPRPTLQDLYDKMGHGDSTRVPLAGDYAPPGYNEEQQHQ